MEPEPQPQLGEPELEPGQELEPDLPEVCWLYGPPAHIDTHYFMGQGVGREGEGRSYTVSVEPPQAGGRPRRRRRRVSGECSFTLSRCAAICPVLLRSHRRRTQCKYATAAASRLKYVSELVDALRLQPLRARKRCKRRPLINCGNAIQRDLRCRAT